PSDGGLCRRRRAMREGTYTTLACHHDPSVRAALAARLTSAGADDWSLTPVHPALLHARVAAYQRQGDLQALAVRQRRHAAALQRQADSLRKSVIPVGVTLLATHDFGRLLETILVEAKTLCNADGGTLYLRTEDDQLRFVIVRNDSLGIAMGGT